MLKLKNAEGIEFEVSIDTIKEQLRQSDYHVYTKRESDKLISDAAQSKINVERLTAENDKFLAAQTDVDALKTELKAAQENGSSTEELERIKSELDLERRSLTEAKKSLSDLQAKSDKDAKKYQIESLITPLLGDIDPKWLTGADKKAFESFKQQAIEEYSGFEVHESVTADNKIVNYLKKDGAFVTNIDGEFINSTEGVYQTEKDFFSARFSAFKKPEQATNTSGTPSIKAVESTANVSASGINLNEFTGKSLNEVVRSLYDKGLKAGQPEYHSTIDKFKELNAK